MSCPSDLGLIEHIGVDEVSKWPCPVARTACPMAAVDFPLPLPVYTWIRPLSLIFASFLAEEPT